MFKDNFSRTIITNFKFRILELDDLCKISNVRCSNI